MLERAEKFFPNKGCRFPDINENQSASPIKKLVKERED